LHGFGFREASTDQVDAVEAALRSLEMDRADRISADAGQDAPPPPAQRTDGMVGGVPLRTKRTGGSGWVRSLLRSVGVPVGDVQ
ncbi:MAG: hypothetical protein KDB69_08590, partial [Acidimicrobiia bacterium]|nr:hypothetical protein [Acidimicrobiia bacterium]